MAARTDDEKIRKQFNFYFSDSNLPYDKFLWTLHSNAENGWIPLSVIAGFKRIQMITTDLDVVLKALKEQESDVYEIDEEGKNIRRKGQVVEQDHVSRSVHVKGFPLVDADAENPADKLIELQDKIDDFFNEKAKVLCTRLKKDGKKFKGTAYVEFENPEQAKKIAELKQVEFDGHTLTILYRPEYHKLKAEEYKDKPSQWKPRQFNAFKPQNDNYKRKRTDSHKGQNKKGKFNKNNKKSEEKKEDKEENKEENKEEKKEEENKE
ncbi:hypothetical protein G6F37_001178 [Rhizopus arrhizus]|nr:hypothetical protein G6F38_006244 [Rhizopus arrhizus]KAG1163474.1 hypothetical protein G6F37_001178 [Rhizopus arrhizus]